MSLFAERAHTALLVVDVQVDAVENAWNRETVIERIDSLAKSARSASIPVIWVRHSDEWMTEGSEAWQIVPELVPLSEEPIVGKQYGDSFEDTQLEAILAELGVDHIVVCGAQTDACIISTLYGGFVRGYDVTLVRDAHTTPDWSSRGLPHPEGVIATVNRIWGGREAPGRTARIATAEVLAAEFSARAEV